MGRWSRIALATLLAVAGYEFHQKGPHQAFGGSLAFLFPEEASSLATEPTVIEDTEEYRWERDRLVRRWRPW